MSTTYRSVKIEGFGQYEEKKSRFLGFARHTENEEEVSRFLAEIRKKYYDASHHCYACVLGTSGENVRSSDDREPSGTAGHPILSVIQGAHITDTTVVVTRYFGGTLLGTGGLVRSYTKAAQEALSAALVMEKYLAEMLSIQIDYSLYGALQQFLMSESLAPANTDFSDRILISLPVETEKAGEITDKITDLTQGKAIIERNEEHLWLEKMSEISL